MAKNKKIVEIDEEAIKGMIIGDVPVFGRDNREAGSPEPKNNDSDDAERLRNIEPCRKLIRPQRKTSDEVSLYRERFLVQTPASYRCQTYIDRNVYERIKRFLPVIACDISISSYIGNILNDHLEHHWSQISELYDNEISKPL